MTDNNGSEEKQPLSELIKETWHLVSRDIAAYLFPLESEVEDDSDRFAGATVKERKAKYVAGRQISPDVAGYRKPLIIKGRRVAKIVPLGLFATALIIIGVIATISIATA